MALDVRRSMQESLRGGLEGPSQADTVLLDVQLLSGLQEELVETVASYRCDNVEGEEIGPQP